MAARRRANLPEVIGVLRSETTAMRSAAVAALYQEGLRIDADSVRMTPVDTGRLRATHYVSPPVLDGTRAKVELGNGTDYAIYVHERTEVAHKTGRSKFLQTAINAAAKGFRERIAKRTKRNMKAGITVAPLDPTVPTSAEAGAAAGASKHEAVRTERRERHGRVMAKRKERRLARRHAAAWKAAEAKFMKRERTTAKREAKAKRKQAQALARQDRRAKAKQRKRRIADFKAAEAKQSKKMHRMSKTRRRRRGKKR